MRQFLCALTAILFLMSSVPAWAENSREQAEEAQLIKDMILYYGWHGDAADEEIKELLSALKAIRPFPGNIDWQGGALGKHHGLLAICQYGSDRPHGKAS